MSRYADLERNGQGTSARNSHSRDVPVWTAIVAGSMVLGAVGAALAFAEEARRHTLRGYWQRLRYEMR